MRWLLLALLAACVPGEGPLMDAGENCQGCHGREGKLYLGERQRHAKTWSVAGTVFDGPRAVEGAEVHLIDANGFDFRLRTNLAGNFYTREAVTFPLEACIERNGQTVCQQSKVTSGACNNCHNLAELGAPQAPLAPP